MYDMCMIMIKKILSHSLLNNELRRLRMPKYTWVCLLRTCTCYIHVRCMYKDVPEKDELDRVLRSFTWRACGCMSVAASFSFFSWCTMVVLLVDTDCGLCLPVDHYSSPSMSYWWLLPDHPRFMGWFYTHGKHSCGCSLMLSKFNNKYMYDTVE